ncbi:hypothetical protein F4811DRAFT_38109 [Daldinia bambusicola]|nr:hypothetical protein F4811DRAFT_38109 [Daldinia bambusicola]
MCHYRKTIYQCNHAVVDPLPLRACEERRNHEAGVSSEPCDVVETHGCTVKVPRLCSSCREKKSHLDGRLGRAKSLIEDLKKELNETYGMCVSHMDEAGLESEARQGGDTSSELKEVAAVEPENAEILPEELMEKIDPVMEKIDPIEEFLRKKKEESDAHLMMIYDYR